MPGTFQFGAIEVNPATRQILVDGVPAGLGARAFDLLLALIERRDRLVPKHELLDIVWPKTVVEDANLHVQVSGLRKLVGPRAIATVPGRGYRFVAALDGAGHAQQIEPDPGVIHDPPALAAPQAASAPGNLTGPPHPLVGRDAALRTLHEQIEAHRLVTIVGASGMGKTALALAAADAQRERWRDGVWLVELAAVTDPHQLPAAVAQALRISLPGAGTGARALDHLASVLGSMTMLLVLDNCEHLVDAVGAWVEGLLLKAPGLRVLATSQELLNVRGEALHKLSPLAAPAAGDDPLDAARYGAIDLFCERARAADLSFTLTSDNAQAVADICRRLDGLPLAIELAAARVRLLGVMGLRDRLGERFRVLTGGARTAMRRHQTLQAALDWSHALLDANEQVVLRRLGVFVGGFSLELAQAVAQGPQLDEWAVLDALGALVDKSLVMADAADPPRYRLLETTRAYALEKLAAAGETDAWISRHAQAVCAWFESVEEARHGERATLSNLGFVHRLAPDIDNARAALDEACGSAGDLNLAFGLAAPLSRVLLSLGLAAEAIQRLTTLQHRLDASVDAARAARFWSSLLFAGHSGRRPMASTLEAAAQAESLFRTAGLNRRLAGTLAGKAQILALAGQPGPAQELLNEARQLQDRALAASSPFPASLIGERLAGQGFIHMMQGQLEPALAVHREQHALLRAAPGERRGLIFSEANVCRDLLLLERDDECIALAEQAIEREGGFASGTTGVLELVLMLAQLASDRIAQAQSTLSLALPGWRRNGTVRTASGAIAVLLAETGQFADAARVAGATRAHLRLAGIDRFPSLRRAQQRLQVLLDAAPCSPADIERWKAEGEALDDAGIERISLRTVPPGA